MPREEVPLSKFAAGRYAGLPTVESAYAQLRGHGRYLRKLKPGIQRLFDSALRPSVGLFLLHRHFVCPPRMRMLETPRKAASGKYEYVTAPTRLSEWPDRALPTRFAFEPRARGVALVPLEYSIDPAVGPALRRLVREPEWVDALYRDLVEAGVADVIGLTILARSKRRAGEAFSERSYRDPLQSVVRLVDRVPLSSRRRIPTVWSAQGYNGCCTVQTVCNAYCDVINDDGSHTSWHMGERDHIPCA